MGPVSRMRFFRWLTAGVLVAGALAVGCTYSPNFRSGSLKCSPDGQCPSGYTCMHQLCCSPGDTACGAAGSGASAAAYVGTWNFSSTATLDTECQGSGSSGGPVSFLTSANPTSTITITANGNALQAAWSEWPTCPYKMSVDSAGAHGTEADTDAQPWGCQFTYTTTTTTPPQLSAQEWIYDSFDIVTTDGRTATHDGVYFRQDTYTDSSVVYCTQVLHAPLTKQ